MMSRSRTLIASGLAFLTVSVQDKTKPETWANRADEPMAKVFSLQKATEFLDGAAARWNKRYGCVTCHTNGLYMLSRPGTSPTGTALTKSRAFAKKYLARYVIDNEKPRNRNGAVEGIVATTSFLAISDMAIRGELDEVTRRGLDRIWELQGEDGAWSGWLKCGWPPFEVDDHFGTTLVTLALGAAPATYRETKVAKQGWKKLRGWLRDHPPANPHQKGMLLWAAARLDVAPAKSRSAWRDELLALQREDGGWRLVDLGAGKWKRKKDNAKQLPSDAYATGFAIFVLLQASVPAADKRIGKGLAWLRANQRASGRWFVRSPKRDGKHFISHAATNFAVMALRASGKRTEKK